MRKLRCFLLVASLAVFGAVASYADALVGYFNLDANLNSIAPMGQVSFALNPDGTIAASLNSFGPNTILGFAFNSVGIDLQESSFTPTAPKNPGDRWTRLDISRRGSVRHLRIRGILGHWQCGRLQLGVAGIGRRTAIVG